MARPNTSPGSTDWRSIIRSQHDDLQKLEAEDKMLNDEIAAKDIDQVLKKSTSYSMKNDLSLLKERGPSGTASGSAKKDSYSLNISIEKEAVPLTGRSGGGPVRPRSGAAPLSSRDDSEPMSPESTVAPKEGVAAARYLKAREKMLSKQVEDMAELKVHLSEQVNDLQRQLKTEREENKNMKKRIQILELENKKSGRRNSDAPPPAEASAQAQELDILRKDLQTAERIAKQGDANAKAKDTQLKRATETISRLKQQIADLLQSAQHEGKDDRSKLDVAEQRIKLLEKQRGDLVAAFKKQMKLIDVLKRQKVHIEAARLLSFVEEDFLKTIEWCA